MDSLKIWFAAVGNNVLGPMTGSELEGFIRTKSDTLVWWQGLEAWVEPSTWYESRASVIAQSSNAFFLNHERHIPRTLSQIVELVSPATDLNLLKFWSPHDEQVKSLFEMPVLCEAMGLPQRKQSRVKLMGTAIISKKDIRISAPIQTISAGGLGAHLGNDISLSGEVMLSLRSPDLVGVPAIRAKVLYSHDGSVGFRFSDIKLEDQTKILSYVRGQSFAA